MGIDCSCSSYCSFDKQNKKQNPPHWFYLAEDQHECKGKLHRMTDKSFDLDKFIADKQIAIDQLQIYRSDILQKSKILQDQWYVVFGTKQYWWSLTTIQKDIYMQRAKRERHVVLFHCGKKRSRVQLIQSRKGKETVSQLFWYVFVGDCGFFNLERSKQLSQYSHDFAYDLFNKYKQ